MATEESPDADGWWWIGFACATADDGDPKGGPGGPNGIPWTRRQVYRTLVDVKGWVEELAECVAAAEGMRGAGGREERAPRGSSEGAAGA